MEAYKSWVRRNRQWLASIESIANTLTWLIPERFASSELAPEAMSTAVGLITVMNQYIVETTPKSMPPWIRSGPGSSQDDKKRLPWPIFVSLMKEVEVLVELTAEHYRGRDGKWSTVSVVEAIKALLRLKIFHDSGYRMIIDGGETENQLDLSQPSYCDPHARRGTIKHSNTNLQGRAMEALYRFGDAAPARPSWLQRREQAVQQPVHTKRNLFVLLKQPSARLFIAGEVSLILRPLIYVLLIRRYGIMSWKPWLASLTIDLTGLSILMFKDLVAKQIEAIRHQGSPLGPLSAPEKNEMKRRQFLLTFYLLRSPFFDRYSRHQVESIEKLVKPLPLFGALTSRALGLLEGVQSIYSYTSAS